MKINIDINSILNNSGSFKELEEKLYQLICEKTKEAFEELIELVDKEIMENRNKDRYKNKDKKERTLKTKIGEMKLERRYYKDKEKDKYCFLLDKYLNIPAYDRQSPALKTAAIKEVLKSTYRNSSETIKSLLDIAISHQAIHNWVQEDGDNQSKKEHEKSQELYENGVIPESEEERKKIEHLFFETDGIHINLQNEDTSSGELKLGMSYRGWEKRHPSSDEYELTKKRYYGGVFDSTRFWKESTVKLYEKYRFKKDAITVLNGDGASWINSGEEYVPSLAHRVLDSYHWNQKILRKLGRSSYVPKVRDAIKEHNKEKLIKILDKAKKYRKKEKDKEKVDELKKYLLNNWEALKDYRELGLDLPDNISNIRGMGAIESNIDKVLANRFKKRGMRWSKDGARNLAKLIIADRNGNLEKILSQRDWNFRDEEFKKEYRTVKDKVSNDEHTVKKGNMPVLEGPSAGEDWVKGLKNIAS